MRAPGHGAVDQTGAAAPVPSIRLCATSLFGSAEQRRPAAGDGQVPVDPFGSTGPGSMDDRVENRAGERDVEIFFAGLDSVASLTQELDLVWCSEFPSIFVLVL